MAPTLRKLNSRHGAYVLPDDYGDSGGCGSQGTDEGSVGRQSRQSTEGCEGEVQVRGAGEASQHEYIPIRRRTDSEAKAPLPRRRRVSKQKQVPCAHAICSIHVIAIVRTGYSRNRPLPSQGGCDVSVPMTYTAAVDVGTVLPILQCAIQPAPNPLLIRTSQSRSALRPPCVSRSPSRARETNVRHDGVLSSHHIFISTFDAQQ